VFLDPNIADNCVSLVGSASSSPHQAAFARMTRPPSLGASYMLPLLPLLARPWSRPVRGATRVCVSSSLPPTRLPCRPPLMRAPVAPLAFPSPPLPPQWSSRQQLQLHEPTPPSPHPPQFLCTPAIIAYLLPRGVGPPPWPRPSFRGQFARPSLQQERHHHCRPSLRALLRDRLLFWEGAPIRTWAIPICDTCR
jgi:hypothetical protein